MPAEKQVRPFADVLKEINGGDSHDELSDALNELVTAVNDTGRVGTLTYVVKVKPAGKNAHGNVIILDEVKIKLPQLDRAESVWFVTSDGNVSRENPNQLKFESLREVPAPAVPVDAETGEIVSNG